MMLGNTSGNIEFPEPSRPPAPRRQPQSFGSGNVTPINMITPYVSKWRICGLCTAKDELKTTKARSGAGDMKVLYSAIVLLLTLTAYMLLLYFFLMTIFRRSHI